MEVTEKTTELVQLVETSGLEKTKQNQIAETLGVFFNKAAEWDTTIKSIVITSPEETGKMKMAKEGRLTLKNMRLEAEKIVKAKRDEVKYEMANFVLEDKLWLKAGQMMEATFKNLETKLEEKEKFAERWEAEQKEKLRAERTELISQFIADPSIYPLGDFTENQFNGLLNGLKLAHEAKIEAEKQAEQKRLEAIRIDELAKERKEKLLPYWKFVPEGFKALNMGMAIEMEFNDILKESEIAFYNHEREIENQRVENERLKKEADEKEKVLAEERRKAKIEREAAEAERMRQLEQIQKEREASEAEARRIAAENEAKLQAERKEREKVEAELKAKAESERKAEIDRLADEEAELSKGDKEKFQSLLADLAMLKVKYKFTSKKHSNLFNQVCELIEKIINFSTEKLK